MFKAIIKLEARGAQMKLTIHKESLQEGKQFIIDHMIQFNQGHFPVGLRSNYEAITLLIKDECGRCCGGLIGEICWNWLQVDYIYVADEIRHTGYGTKLLQTAERMAKDKECAFAKLDTLSFQALEFYLKQGYECFGQLENAGGYTHYYLKKDL